MVQPIGLFSYQTTVIALERLESAGVPTLTGSPEGWPVLTTIGLVIAAAGWFFVYFGPLALLFVEAKRRRMLPARTVRSPDSIEPAPSRSHGGNSLEG
jgi:hypothetical protein